jgi:hypothetical protein
MITAITARGNDMVRSIFTCLVRLFKESGKIPLRQASGMILFDNDESSAGLCWDLFE